MPHRILRIDSSSRPSPAGLPGESEGSYSRDLADHLVDHLRDQHPDAEVIVRDVAANPVPHIADMTIRGYYTPPEAMTDALRGATRLSDELIAELKAADSVVISAPIYNFAIPSALKAWIDHIVRIGRTFAYEDGAFSGLVDDKPVYVALSYGAAGYGEDGPLQEFDFLKPYLTMILNFIGLNSVEFFAIEATTSDAETVAAGRRNALRHIDDRLASALVA